MSKKRLIDADALIHRLCAERDGVQIEHACDIGYHNGLNMAVAMTINIPTIDAVEVVHGRWIWNEEDECYVCSNCELSALNNYRGNSTDSNYCPNCGAKMDGE